VGDFQPYLFYFRKKIFRQAILHLLMVSSHPWRWRDYDSNFCFDIWRVTNADYLFIYFRCEQNWRRDSTVGDSRRQLSRVGNSSST